MGAYSPDELDQGIISALRRNGRQPNSEVARQLGVTEATIRSRIQRLVAEGVMQVVAMTNPHRIGYALDVLIGIEVVPGKLFDVARELQAFEEVRVLSIVTGRYDIHAAAIFRDNDELFRFLTEKLAVIEGLKKYETFHVLRTVKRSYDYWKSPLEEKSSGGQPS